MSLGTSPILKSVQCLEPLQYPVRRVLAFKQYVPVLRIIAGIAQYKAPVNLYSHTCMLARCEATVQNSGWQLVSLS